jgi:ABC-type multidrug transport system fused ATPase/permease subunit
MSDDATMTRLDDQIDWYDRNSKKSQTYYKILKFIVILAAALIPLLSSSSLPFAPQGVPSWFLGALGALIAIIEGIQQLNQYQTNWISYRSTCESLRHEKYLYLGQAGAYASAANPHALLAERIENLVSQEDTKWASLQETQKQGKGGQDK